MKIFKIIFAVVIGIGVLVGIMFIVRNLTDKKQIKTDEESEEYPALKQEIEADWKDLSHWDLNLYKEEMAKVDDAFSTEQISRSNLDNLIIDINSNALMAIEKSLPQLMKAAKWDSTKINAEMVGIDSISKVPVLAQKDEVVRAQTVYRLYHEITSWTNKTAHAIVSSYYNGSVTSWTNFNTIVSQTESQASRFKNSKYYKEYLANKLTKPLTDAVSHVNGLRGAYYNAIAQSIINHYPIENWDGYQNPLEAFLRVQKELNQASNKLKSEDPRAAKSVDEYKSKFNRTKPKESTN